MAGVGMRWYSRSLPTQNIPCWLWMDLLPVLTTGAFNSPSSVSLLTSPFLLMNFLASRLLTAVVHLLLIKKAAWAMGMWIGEIEPPSPQPSVSTWLKSIWLTTGRPLFSCCLSAIAWFLSELPGQVLSVSLDFLDPLTMGSVRTDLLFKRWELWNLSRSKAMSLACKAWSMSVLLLRNSNVGRVF